MTKFQADKPFHGFKADKDFWFYETTEFEKPREQWQFYYDSQLSEIHDRFCQIDPQGIKTGYKNIRSPLYFLGHF
jgi:hypothetical protein